MPRAKSTEDQADQPLEGGVTTTNEQNVADTTLPEASGSSRKLPEVDESAEVLKTALALAKQIKYYNDGQSGAVGVESEYRLGFPHTSAMALKTLLTTLNGYSEKLEKHGK